VCAKQENVAKNAHAFLHNHILAVVRADVTCTALALGQPLSVKPSRIIAGQEPEKTNEFLQAIARAVLKKVFKFPVNTFSVSFV